MTTQGKGTIQDSTEEYHSQIAVLMSPAIAVMGMMMLVGFFGNILVIYIYAVRLKRSTTHLFITALAVADTVVCIVCIPVEIVVVRYLYSFDIPWLCRVFRTIVLACVITSISVLISIAVHRYKRVCTPFKSQISLKRAKIAVGVGCLVAITLASPSMVILGRKTVNRTVIGYACATDDSMVNTPFPGLFNGMQLLIAVISISTITTLYALILKRIRAQKRYREGMNPNSISRKACSTQSDEASSVTDTVITSTRESTLTSAQSDITTSDDMATSSRDNAVTSTPQKLPSGDDTITSTDDTTTSPMNKNRRKVAKVDSGLKNGTHKTTFMMFIITAVFILSFVPHLALMATRAVQKHTYDHLEGVPLALYNLFFRTFFINSVSNPIIYGFMSDKFRTQAKLVFRRMCCKKERNRLESEITPVVHQPVFTMRTQGKGTIQDSTEEYHSQIAVLMSPAIAVMGMMMLVGFFGNILVIYIYAVRLKRSTTHLFITALAVADTVVCIVCIPVEIVVVRYLYSFDIPWLCRVLRTIVLACVITSTSVLISIAVHRYKRVCTPFKSQISLKRAKIAVGVGCLVAITLASPSMVILGRKTVNRTVIGYACATDDSMVKTPFPGLFNGMQLLIAVISISTITTLYALILKRIRAQKRYREGMNPNSIPRKTCSTQSDEASSVTDTVITSTRESTLTSAQSDITTSDDMATSSRDNAVTSTPQELPSGDDTITWTDDTTTSPMNKNRRKVAKVDNGLKNGTHKTTFMMFIITAVFILSFVPHLALMATRAVQKHTYDHLEGVPLALYNLFLRTYFINSVSNPIIYGFMSDKFRSQAKLVFRRMCCKK
ncbi:uncharacterized protein [Haliotis asinina]|uniref:uncharacterized protein n=1 Tax=Haliotis asinina TaxID=109174 RepID=UPI003531EBF2